jgi:hypothetical protein
LLRQDLNDLGIKMRNIYWTSKLFSLFLIVLLFSCAEENPDLVNPPPQYETINIRFINLAKEDGQIQLTINEFDQNTAAAYSFCTSSENPPADSGYVGIKVDGNQVLKEEERAFFIRLTNYTFVALPSNPKDSVQNEIDTVVKLANIPGKNVTGDYCIVKFLNAFPDSSSKFTLTLGCQNGEQLFSNVDYMKIPSSNDKVPIGNTAVTLVQRENSTDNVIGLFELNLVRNEQYTLIVYKKDDGEPGLMFIDDKDLTVDAQILPPIIPEKVTYIRSVNYRSEPIDFVKNGTEIIAQGLTAGSIGNYVEVGACQSLDQDLLQTVIDGDTVHSLYTSLEVLSDYSAFTFDIGIPDTAITVLAPPVKLDPEYSTIRVIHAATQLSELTVSLAARNRFEMNEDKTEIIIDGYQSGTYLTTDISFSEISDPVRIQEGWGPITIFTNTSPINLIHMGVTEFVKNKEYILVITNDDQGNPLLSVIADGDENKAIKYIDEGVFAQFVHLVPGELQLEYRIPPIVESGGLFYTGGLATVLPAGNHTIYANGVPLDIEAIQGERIFVIAAGEKDNIELIYNNYPPIESGLIENKRRFVNASNEVQLLNVKFDSTAESYVSEDIPYRNTSSTASDTLDRKISMYFFDVSQNKFLFRIDPPAFVKGKGYTIIAGGKEAAEFWGYTSVILQEY